MAQINLFGIDNQVKRLSDLGDQLETLDRVVDFEVRSGLGNLNS